MQLKIPTDLSRSPGLVHASYSKVKRLPGKRVRLTCGRKRKLGLRRKASASAGANSSEEGRNFDALDDNQLQTALNNAIAAEQYSLAASLRDKLRSTGKGHGRLDWRALGMPDWLAERAEQMGFKYPTGECLYSTRSAFAAMPLHLISDRVSGAEVQRRCCSALQQGARDVVAQSETGSGKTLAFVLPLLSALDYPPALFPEDLLVRPPRKCRIHTTRSAYREVPLYCSCALCKPNLRK